jgi:hypothetical protein
MIAKLPGTSIAPPIPCKARAMIRCRMSGATPHQADAVANRNTPTVNTRRRPYKSPAAPPSRISAARKSAYDSTTHCASATVAFSARWILGKATLTTVPSIKARLEPRMVAVRTHPGRVVGPDAIAPVAECAEESQGYFRCSLPGA